MCRKACHRDAPSTDAASKSSAGSTSSPAYITRNMNGIVRQASTSVIDTSARVGSLSHGGRPNPARFR